MASWHWGNNINSDICSDRLYRLQAFSCLLIFKWFSTLCIGSQDPYVPKGWGCIQFRLSVLSCFFFGWLSLSLADFFGQAQMDTEAPKLRAACAMQRKNRSQLQLFKQGLPYDYHGLPCMHEIYESMNCEQKEGLDMNRKCWNERWTTRINIAQCSMLTGERIPNIASFAGGPRICKIQF